MDVREKSTDAYGMRPERPSLSRKLARLVKLLLAFSLCLSLLFGRQAYETAARYLVSASSSIWATECQPRPHSAPWGLLRQLSDDSSKESRILNPYPAKPRVTFDSEGKFKIMVFSDLHYGEAEDLEWGPEQDRKSGVIMRAMLKSEKPDFVVINGDLITGENTYKENVTAYLDLMLAPLIEAGVPFATTFGNHDNQANITHLEQIKHIQKIAPLAYTMACGTCGGEGGEANYYLPIYPKSCAHAPALLLWFFDSRGGISPESKPLPDWVDEDVADWVEDISGTMKASWGEGHQALIFAHIAPNLMKDLQKTLNSTAEPGLNADVMGAGSVQSSIGATGKDLKWWRTVNERIPNIIATVHGHDHGNEWCARDPESQLILCFNKHTGYGGYDGPGWGHGVRIFELSLDRKPRTYIKMENGTSHADIVLDETYDVKVPPSRTGVLPA